MPEMPAMCRVEFFDAFYRRYKVAVGRNKYGNIATSAMRLSLTFLSGQAICGRLASAVLSQSR
jgi:hypothetical protein